MVQRAEAEPKCQGADSRDEPTRSLSSMPPATRGPRQMTVSRTVSFFMPGPCSLWPRSGAACAGPPTVPVGLPLVAGAGVATLRGHHEAGHRCRGDPPRVPISVAVARSIPERRPQGSAKHLPRVFEGAGSGFRSGSGSGNSVLSYRALHCRRLFRESDGVGFDAAFAIKVGGDLERRSQLVAALGLHDVEALLLLLRLGHGEREIKAWRDHAKEHLHAL